MDENLPGGPRMESTFPQAGAVPLYSPYLNFDPSYINSGGPEYILPEGASARRGRFELAFSQIGTCVIGGSAVGGARGLFQGIRETSSLPWLVRRSQLINYTMKGGSGVANKLGTVSVMYAAFGVILSSARGTDDAFNTVASGTLTGLLYKSTAGLRGCGIGGAVGLGIASAYVALTSDAVRKML